MTDRSIARFQFSTEDALSFVLKFTGISLAGRTLRVKVKDRASSTTRATLTIGAGLTVTGTDQVSAAVATADMVTWPRGEYSADLVDITGAPSTIMAVRFVYDLPGNLPYGASNRVAYVTWGENKAYVTATGAVGPAGPTGPQGEGWSPVLAISNDGARRVQRVVDWTGGTGDKPATGLYVGAAGLVSDIANGVDIRGSQGAQGIQGNVGNTGAQGDKGWSPATAIVSDGVRRVLQVVDWVGGAGTKPGTGYVGATGLVPNIADGIDIRGPQGPSGSVVDGDKGDIVVSGSGSTWTVDARSVDFSKLRAIATARLLGRNTSGSGDVEELSPSVARFVLQITAQGEAIILASDAATQRAAMGVAAASPGDFVLSWTGTAPGGTMKANGAAVSRTTYAALDTAIYCGDANNPTADWGYRCTDPLNPSTTRSTTGTHIVLPDGRGEFFRGFDDGRGVDSGRNLWRAQAQAIQSHTHGINDPGHTHSLAGGPNANGSGTVAPGAQSGNSSFVGGLSGAVTGITVQSAGGTETRPRNLSPLVCIRY